MLPAPKLWCLSLTGLCQSTNEILPIQLSALVAFMISFATRRTRIALREIHQGPKIGQVAQERAECIASLVSSLPLGVPGSLSGSS